MRRRRDCHVVGETKYQVVALADLPIYHVGVEFEHDAPERGVIAHPCLDRRGGVSACRGRPQRQRGQHGNAADPGGADP